MNEDYLTVQAARQSFLDKYRINSNLLETSKYMFVSHNMPHLNFFAQSVMLPSVSIGEYPQENPYVAIYRAGDKIQYEPLTVTFLVDEDLKVWEEIYNWQKGLTFPHSREEYREQKKRGLYADVSVLFLTNSFNSNITFKFTDCFPIFLGPIQFSSSSDSEEVLQTDVTFRFTTFEIWRGQQ